MAKPKLAPNPEPWITERGYVQVECGCVYAKDGTIIGPCEADRYMTCGKCGGRAEISPIGLLCPRCTFK